MIENEYAEYYAQVALEKKFNPCDPYTGAYMLLDEASPDEPPKYFTSLEGAVNWAETDNQYISYQGVEQWSVYRVGDKVLWKPRTNPYSYQDKKKA